MTRAEAVATEWESRRPSDPAAEPSTVADTIALHSPLGVW